MNHSDEDTDFYARKAEQPAPNCQVDLPLDFQAQVLAHIQDAVVAIDTQRRIIYWNSGAERIYGLTSQQALGRSVDEAYSVRWLHPDDEQHAAEALYQTGQWQGELIHTLHNGSDIFVEASVSRLPDTQGLLATIRNITARKRAEAQLKLSEQRARMIANATTMIVWAVQPNGYLEFCNQVWTDYTGLTVEQTRQQPYLAIHPDDIANCTTTWQTAIQTGEPYQLEYRIRRASDGLYRWHLGRAVPLHDRAGAIISWVGTGTDIDDQKQAEARLRLLAQASERLAASVDYGAALLDIAPLAVPLLADWVVIYLLEPDHRLCPIAFAHTNSAKQSLLEAFVECYPVNLDTPYGIGLATRTGQASLLSNLSDPNLHQYIQPKEQVKLLDALGTHSSIVVPMLAHGRVLGAIQLVYGDSGRSYTQADLALSADLAQRIALAIDNAWLHQQAQRALETQQHLNRLKDEFISVASHELRTPLTTLKGYVQLLQRQGQTEADQQRIDRMLKNVDMQVDRMSSLISEMLDVVRLQRGRLELTYTRQVNLVELVQQAIEQQQAMNPDHAIFFQTEPEPIFCTLDVKRIEQVVHNLLTNALKYSASTQLVTVGIQQHPGEVMFWVRDAGSGIRDEDQPHLFERFYRSHHSTIQSVDGLGLGLAISHELVTRHGGRIWFTSTVGVGSTFYVALPLHAPPADPSN